MKDDESKANESVLINLSQKHNQIRKIYDGASVRKMVNKYTSTPSVGYPQDRQDKLVYTLLIRD